MNKTVLNCLKVKKILKKQVINVTKCMILDKIFWTKITIFNFYGFNTFIRGYLFIRRIIWSKNVNFSFWESKGLKNRN